MTPVAVAAVKVVRERPLYQDPFDPVLKTVNNLAVNDEQNDYIKRVLNKACSDSKFAEKAYIAITKILSGSLLTPVVSALNPSNVVLGSPVFDLHVMGSNFTPESVIVFNGFDEPTTFVSASELTTGVNMPLWQAPAVVPVMVRSAEEVLSNSMNFEFKEIPVLLSAPTLVHKSTTPAYKEKELIVDKSVKQEKK
jgi:hypothetical protein